MKRISFVLLALVFLQIHPLRVKAQHPEIGISVVLSGALMFGPYFDYWLDDHQALEASIMAAWDEEFKIPFALNAGYGYYFGSSKWRPNLTFQYSLLIPSLSEAKSLLSALPGVQYRWDNSHQETRLGIWVSSFLSKEKITPWRVMPIGLQLNYGYKNP
jgi:hypothetical protein